MFLSTKVNSAVQSSSLGNYTSWKEPENHDWSLYMGIFFPFIHSSSSKELLRDAAIRPVIAISTYQHLGGGGGGNREKGREEKNPMCYLISVASRYCLFNSCYLSKHLIML